jgi:hypothetical protein
MELCYAWDPQFEYDRTRSAASGGTHIEVLRQSAKDVAEFFERHRPMIVVCSPKTSSTSADAVYSPETRTLRVALHEHRHLTTEKRTELVLQVAQRHRHGVLVVDWSEKNIEHAQACKRVFERLDGVVRCVIFANEDEASSSILRAALVPLVHPRYLSGDE